MQITRQLSENVGWSMDWRMARGAAGVALAFVTLRCRVADAGLAGSASSGPSGSLRGRDSLAESERLR